MGDENARKKAESYLKECKEYTDAYEHEKLVRDWERKGEVAKNVVNDFTRRAGDPQGKRVLDVGFGNGEYALAFARAGGKVHGLEVNSILLQLARENIRAAGFTADLQIYNGSTFPFADNFFDYAYSVSVLEHTSNPGKILEEVHRTLKPSGKFYLAFPNRIALRETHTGIWGLNYVPRSLAQFLLRRIWGRNSIEELNLHFLSYWQIKRLAQKAGFRIVYEVEAHSGLRRLLKRLLATMGMHHSAILTTVMVILVKR